MTLHPGLTLPSPDVRRYLRHYNGTGFGWVVKWLAGAQISLPRAHRVLVDSVEDALIACCSHFGDHKTSSTSCRSVAFGPAGDEVLVEAIAERLPRLDDAAAKDFARTLVGILHHTLRDGSRIMIDGAFVSVDASGFLVATVRPERRAHRPDELVQLREPDPTIAPLFSA